MVGPENGPYLARLPTDPEITNEALKPLPGAVEPIRTTGLVGTGPINDIT
jgi:hypothetical protein